MNKRFVAVTMLALAVLYSQGGGTVLAAICPHLRSLNNTCHDMAAGTEHHTMSHAPAETSSEPAKGDAVEANDPGMFCNHCAVRTRNKRDESVLQQPNLTQRGSDVITLTPLFIVAYPPAHAATWVARAHGPPGSNAPLHVLINFFRI
jgi:hypothetical protein